MRSRSIRADPPRSRGEVRNRPCGPGCGRVVCLLSLAVALLVLGSPAARAQAPEGGRGPSGDEVQRHRGYPVRTPASLQGAVFSDVRRDGGRLTARMQGDRLVLVAGSPFVRIGGEVRQLANPPYIRGGVLWIPTELLSARAGRASRSSSRPRGAGSGRPWRVVIDPGHGGRDPGTRAPSGTLEKEVTLAVGKQLKEALEQRDGIEPSLTRSRDVFVPLDRRSEIAVERNADLFVSVHANSEPTHGVRGFETFVLGEARTEEAKRVAMRENASLRFESGSPRSVSDQVEYILASNDLQAWRQESSYVAGYMQNQLREVLSSSDRGVKQAAFYVLMGARRMPTVLVEVGFLSHPREARVLRSRGGQARIADALAEAVTAYFEKREERVLAGTGEE